MSTTIWRKTKIVLGFVLGLLGPYGLLSILTNLRHFGNSIGGPVDDYFDTGWFSSPKGRSIRNELDELAKLSLTQSCWLGA